MENKHLPSSAPDSDSPVTYREVDQYMREINAEVSPKLREAVKEIDDDDAREIVDYFFGPRYDQPKGRPLLARLAFEVVADLRRKANPQTAGLRMLDPKIGLNFLVSLRLLDGASILHDDILDHNQMRDGQESVVKKFGYERALVAGEIARELAYKIFSRAVDDQEKTYDEQISRKSDVQIKDSGRTFIVGQASNGRPIKRNVDIQRKVTDIYNDIWFKGNVGQLLDMEAFNKNKTVSMKDYLKRLYLLTGQFFERVMILGAYDAGIDQTKMSKELEILGNYGKYYGIAAQLRNDLLDFVPEGGFKDKTAADRKFSYQDFTEGKQTMPIILAKEKCPDSEWQFIHSRIGDKKLSNHDKQAINEILVKRGIIRECGKKIFELSKMAINEINKLKIKSRKKEMLIVWALVLSNLVKKSFAGEKVDQELKLDSLEQLEKYFKQKPTLS